MSGAPPAPRMVTCELSRVVCWLARRGTRPGGVLDASYLWLQRIAGVQEGYGQHRPQWSWSAMGAGVGAACWAVRQTALRKWTDVGVRSAHWGPETQRAGRSRPWQGRWLPCSREGLGDCERCWSCEQEQRGGAELFRGHQPCCSEGGGGRHGCALFTRSGTLPHRRRVNRQKPHHSPQPQGTPLCDIPSGCCLFTGPWTVTRTSLRMLRRVAAFCRPLQPVMEPRGWCAGAVLDVAGCAVCASAAPSSWRIGVVVVVAGVV